MTEPFDDFYSEDDWDEAESSYSQPVGEYLAEVSEPPRWVLTKNGIPELRVKARITETYSGEPGNNRVLNPAFPLLPDAWAKAIMRRFVEVAGLGSYTALLPQVVDGNSKTFRSLLEAHGELSVDQFPVPMPIRVKVSSKVKTYTSKQTGEEREATNYYYNIKSA